MTEGEKYFGVGFVVLGIIAPVLCGLCYAANETYKSIKNGTFWREVRDCLEFSIFGCVVVALTTGVICWLFYIAGFTICKIFGI